MLPFEIWRETFINDADIELARSTYNRLNPQPYGTMANKISLQRPLSEMSIGRSYINCQQDISLPHSYPWHPRLSERLGLFRLVELPGSHETIFSNPVRLAQAIWEAARD
jgi:hypothetical protein